MPEKKSEMMKIYYMKVSQKIVDMMFLLRVLIIFLSLSVTFNCYGEGSEGVANLENKLSEILERTKGFENDDISSERKSEIREMRRKARETKKSLSKVRLLELRGEFSKIATHETWMSLSYEQFLLEGRGDEWNRYRMVADGVLKGSDLRVEDARRELYLSWTKRLEGMQEKDLISRIKQLKKVKGQ